MIDLAVRLTEALDRTELEARSGVSDDSPGTVLRLIARDRALLERHRPTFGEDDESICARCRDPWPCRDVEDAAAFWLPEESP